MSELACPVCGRSWTDDEVKDLLAEVDPLRADLADARRERDEAREAFDNLTALHRALLLPTAGGGGPAEGGGE